MLRIAGFVVVFGFFCLGFVTRPHPVREVSTTEEGRLADELLSLAQSTDARRLWESVKGIDTARKFRVRSAIESRILGVAEGDVPLDALPRLLEPHLRALTALFVPERCGGRSLDTPSASTDSDALDTYFQRHRSALAVRNSKGQPVEPWVFGTKGKGTELAMTFVSIVPSSRQNAIGNLEANAKALTRGERVLLEQRLLKEVVREAGTQGNPSITSHLFAITALRVANVCDDEAPASKAAPFNASACPAKTQPVECYEKGLIYLNKSGGYDTGDRTLLCRVSSSECEGKASGYRFCAPCEGTVSCGGCSQHARGSHSQRWRRPADPHATTATEPKEADRPIVEPTIGYAK